MSIIAENFENFNIVFRLDKWARKMEHVSLLEQFLFRKKNKSIF